MSVLPICGLGHLSCTSQALGILLIYNSSTHDSLYFMITYGVTYEIPFEVEPFIYIIKFL